ncbi:MAG TPA: hypothetical protein VK830_05355 [Xanthomonadales bacterium]|nr:hypothetical protein [Xanthomonadales bacterium]
MKPWLACPLAAAFLLAACKDERSVEQQIIGVITEMETLAEAGERRAFMNFVDDDFQGQHGQMLRDDFHRFMVLQWNQNQKLHAQLFPIRVEPVDSDLARARFRALITGGRGLIPERGELYQIETTWRRHGSDWLLLEANWVPVRDAQSR